MASDFSLPEFRFLERLLIVHGHWCYRRISKMVKIHFFTSKTTLVIHQEMWKPAVVISFLAADSLFCLQKHCIWPHSVLLQHLHRLLGAGLVRWLVHGHVQRAPNVVASHLPWRPRAGCFIRCLFEGKHTTKSSSLNYKKIVSNCLTCQIRLS